MYVYVPTCVLKMWRQWGWNHSAKYFCLLPTGALWMFHGTIFIVYDEGLFAVVEGIIFNVFLWLQVSRHAVAGNITCLYFIFVKNRKSCNNLYRLEHEKQFPAAMQRPLHHIQCLFKVYWTVKTSLSNITLVNLISFVLWLSIFSTSPKTNMKPNGEKIFLSNHFLNRIQTGWPTSLTFKYMVNVFSNILNAYYIGYCPVGLDLI